MDEVSVVNQSSAQHHANPAYPAARLGLPRVLPACDTLLGRPHTQPSQRLAFQPDRDDRLSAS